jgi:ABC-type metal ion transport system, periplasmic component/surface adhesin
MKTNKNFIYQICIVMLTMTFFLFLLSGCSDGQKAASAGQTDSKIKITATLFPQYDFARQIAGDKAEVTLLLPPGVESHSYGPTPSDVIKINNSDLFLYTGKHMEIWSQKIIDSMEDSDCIVVDLSKDVEMIHDGDPHFWTDPLIAKKMVDQIAEALCEADPKNADYYKSNAARYNEKLDQLDAEFRAIVKNSTRKEIIFGSAFAFSYFTKEYGLSYEAAFDSCSSETEPSAKTITRLIEEIKRENIPVIYYMEIEDPKIAKSICRETGAKMLLLHSCHNVTRKEMESGATYLSLMKQNALNLKEGLN